MPPPATTILLVEDNPADVVLTREALKANMTGAELEVVTDGEQALEVLGHGLRPSLILLDLNLPRMSGHEVLAALKATPELNDIPVIVFSSSVEQADVNAAYEGKANCYVTKPDGFDDYVRVLGQIESFWMNVVARPFATAGAA